VIVVVTWPSNTYYQRCVYAIPQAHKQRQQEVNEKARASTRRRLNESVNNSIGLAEEMRMDQTILHMDSVAMGRLMTVDGWE
jgi:hypothetical protein